MMNGTLGQVSGCPCIFDVEAGNQSISVKQEAIWQSRCTFGQYIPGNFEGFASFMIP